MTNPAAPNADAPVADDSRRVLLLVAWIAIASRIALVLVGRVTVLDGFYLHAAWRLARGDTPYHDFTHVAFPTVEAFYAPFLRVGSLSALALDPWRLASCVTGLAVVATAMLIAKIALRGFGPRVAILAGVLYVIAPPIVAYHAFEREIWTNLGLALALYSTIRTERACDRTAATVGILLAFTITCKLTAVLGAIAIGLELARRGGLRALGIATASTVLLLGAFSLLLFSAYGAEFVTQVFLFYFFKGDASSVGERLLALVHDADPVLALGLVALVIPGRASRLVAPLRLLGCTWLGYYALGSPSYWDHNAIDLLLPASILAASFVVSAVERRSIVKCVVVVALVIATTHLLEDRETRWRGTPWGFGSNVRRKVFLERDTILGTSNPGDLIVVPNPLTGVLSGRVPFVSDFEMEPVARGLLREIRATGFAAAFARRRIGAVLGVPDARAMPVEAGSLFAARGTANLLAHLIPRIFDAATKREIATLIGEPPKEMESVFISAGYERIDEQDIKGWKRAGGK